MHLESCTLVALGLALCVSGCSSDGGSPSTAGGSGNAGIDTGGQGAAANGGGGTTGGARPSGGGSSGGTGDGGSHLAGVNCSPGTTYEGPYAYAPGTGPVKSCGMIDPIGAGKNLPVDCIELSTPLAAGDTFAFSIEFSSASSATQMEVWGANSSCGTGQQLIGTGHMGNGIECVAGTVNASYKYILLVYRGARETASQTICPLGTCGG